MFQGGILLLGGRKWNVVRELYFRLWYDMKAVNILMEKVEEKGKLMKGGENSKMPERRGFEVQRAGNQ